MSKETEIPDLPTEVTPQSQDFGRWYIDVVRRAMQGGATSAECVVREGDEFVYTVSGSGFLHHMVRNLVGTFLLVGKGTLAVPDVQRILEARNRSAAGATAPAAGLCLVKVEYRDDC